MVYRIYVEKKPGFDVEANGLKNELTSLLGIKDLTGLRLLNRYDVEGIDEEPRRSDFHAGRSGTRRSCQFARNTRFLSFILNHFSACQRSGRHSLCRGTRTVYRPKHRLLSSRCY